MNNILKIHMQQRPRDMGNSSKVGNDQQLVSIQIGLQFDPLPQPLLLLHLIKKFCGMECYADPFSPGKKFTQNQAMATPSLFVKSFASYLSINLALSACSSSS